MEDLTKSSNKIYSEYFVGNKLLEKWNNNNLIHKTDWRGELSNNSFCLKAKSADVKEIPEILIKRFGINDKELFKTKYHEAISGDGQERTRISTLHSSSLIALLCFYSISNVNPIVIKGYKFTESYFEVQTKVYKNSKSNMDVVLRGTDNCGNKVVLFLECKFSEYLSGGKYDKISKDAYEDTYKGLGLFNSNSINGVRITSEDDGICISSDSPLYCGGVKQMLSHYIGVSNYSEQREKALANRTRFKADPDEKVLLGEIIFDFQREIFTKKLAIFSSLSIS